MSDIIRVLVVDDSAFVRKVVTQMLGRSPFIEVVGAAHDGQEALEMVERLEPDVVTLDLVMPGMDGLEFLRRQMAIRPLPVVMCSISHESGAPALEAFELGAVEFVQKPTALATDRVFDIAEELVAKVKAAATVRPALTRRASAADDAARAASVDIPAPGSRRADVVVIGVSTGGPQALREIIPRIPADFPLPVLVVLHMPIGYTEMYANRLNEISQIRVVEASDGEAITGGTMYLAPAGRHLSLRRVDDGVQAHLDSRPTDTPHRPAVDVLFRSAAEVYGPRVLAVVMTGMGNDGLMGAAAVKAKGGRVLTEDESSCIVYGMPRAVAEAGLSDARAPLGDILRAIMEMV